MVHHLVETLRALGAHGECVIVGCGAAFILPAKTTLRVRLVSPLPQRIQVVSRQYGISEQEAAATTSSRTRRIRPLTI